MFFSARSPIPFTIPEVDFATTDYMHLLNNAVSSQITANLIYNDGQTATQFFSIGAGTVNRIREMTSATGTKANRLRLYVSSGATIDMKLSPMICHTTTATSYAPYSNICPISGHNKANVTVAAENLLDDSKFRLSSWNKYGIPNSLQPNTTYRFMVGGTSSYSYRLYITSTAE